MGILLTATLILSVCACGTTQQTATFTDANLEAAIRKNINKPQGPIYISNLEALTTLQAQEGGISDLTGLEYCVNLQELYLYTNNISDISVLAGLINLEGLHLTNNNISDISPLVWNSGFSNGDAVWLWYNPLSITSVDVYISQLEERGVIVTY